MKIPTVFYPLTVHSPVVQIKQTDNIVVDDLDDEGSVEALSSILCCQDIAWPEKAGALKPVHVPLHPPVEQVHSVHDTVHSVKISTLLQVEPELARTLYKRYHDRECLTLLVPHW